MKLVRQCFVTANVSMTLVGNGCAIGIAAILIPSLRTKESQIHATVNEESWIAGALGFSLIFGNILVIATLDKIGRKKCHFISVVPVLVGWFILLFATNVQGLLASRFLQGFAIGISGFLGAIIIGEMTEPKYRGIFLTMVSLSLTIGVLFTHALGSFFSWQTSALVCSFTTFTSLIMLFYTPESPAWLIKEGRYQEAKDIFFWLRGNGASEEIEFEKMVTAQKLIRKSSIASQDLSTNIKMRRKIGYFIETCKKPEFYKPTFIMVWLYVVYQFGGINVINSYTIDIIEQIVGPEANSKLLMIVLDVERLVCNILALYLMKIMKRRTLLFSTGFGCVLSYFTQAAYVYMKQNGRLAYDHQWIPITLIAVYMFLMTVGISSVPFALAGEIFPLEYRGTGGGISMMSLSINFFLSVKLFPVLISSMGLPLTYVLYACIVVVGLCITWFMLPETKDRTLQDIEDTFRGYSPGDVKSSVPLKENDRDVMEMMHSNLSVHNI